MPAKKYFTSDKKQESISSNLNQVIDVIQEDISGSATRRKYQTFVTGGLGPGVTSSLYQTVYDQDFTLQTANAVMDMTVGLFHDEQETPRANLVTQGTSYYKTSNGQLTFDTKHTMMMREKVNIYRQYAKLLLGDADKPFILSDGTTEKKCTVDEITAASVGENRVLMDACVFINVKRLFARDKIRKETFAMRLYENAPRWYLSTDADLDGALDPKWVWNYDPEDGQQVDPLVTPSNYDSDGNYGQPNLFGTTVESSEDGVYIIADINASVGSYGAVDGGEWAFLRKASDISKVVGLIFYDAGIVVLNLGGSTCNASNTWGNQSQDSEALLFATNLDGGEGQAANVEPVFNPRDRINGVIAGMSPAHAVQMDPSWGADDGTAQAGQVFIGKVTAGVVTDQGTDIASAEPNTDARFYPDLLVSASIDDIVDHIGFTRFSSGSLTATAFQNVTNINSSIYFCRATAAQFNGSTNPTWLGDDDEWVLSGTETDPYTYITTVLLYDDEDDIVAVAKLNRPIEKNNQSELTIRVRLDF